MTNEEKLNEIQRHVYDARNGGTADAAIIAIMKIAAGPTDGKVKGVPQSETAVLPEEDRGPMERVYDTVIADKVSEIIEVCTTHGIPAHLHFDLDRDEDDEGGRACTTHLAGKEGTMESPHMLLCRLVTQAHNLDQLIFALMWSKNPAVEGSVAMAVLAASILEGAASIKR